MRQWYLNTAIKPQSLSLPLALSPAKWIVLDALT